MAFMKGRGYSVHCQKQYNIMLRLGGGRVHMWPCPPRPMLYFGLDRDLGGGEGGGNRSHPPSPFRAMAKP